MKKKSMKSMKSVLTVILIAISGTLSLSVTGSAQQDPRADANTMLLLTFNEGNGNTTSDLSGNGNDGELKGAEWAEGKFGGGIEIKDDGDCVVMPLSPTLDLTDALSLEAWVKPATVSVRMDIISKHESGGYALIIDEGGIMRASFHIAGNYIASRSVSVLQAEEWYYLAATFDGEALRVYVDGELEGETAATGTVTTTTVPLAIGGNAGPGGIVSSYYFKGLVDELRVSNVARTDEEIMAAMKTEGAGAIEPAGKLSITWSYIKTH